MRLICPNCGAQYAVDGRMIPLSGRDVQCSSCGHTWFQAHPDADPELAEELDAAPAPVSHEPPPMPARREPDPAALSVLREEAARERAAREAERAALEMQGDLDLPMPARARPGPVLPSGEDALRATRPAPRRSLLPDIEEINSTLEPSDHVAARSEALSSVERVERVRRTTGRRIGVGLSVGLFVCATLLYVQGPRIGAAVPAFKPSLDSYVASVDAGRRWLDGALRRAAGAAAPDSEG